MPIGSLPPPSVSSSQPAPPTSGSAPAQAPASATAAAASTSSTDYAAQMAVYNQQLQKYHADYLAYYGTAAPTDPSKHAKATPTPAHIGPAHSFPPQASSYAVPPSAVNNCNVFGLSLCSI